MPRIRDFRGLNARSFDDAANYAMGLKEQSCSPKSATTEKVRGMDIIQVTTRQVRERWRANCCVCWLPPFQGEARSAKTPEQAGSGVSRFPPSRHEKKRA